MRKLASIRKVKEIVPIEGADFIEIVKLDGWQCVSKKGEFSIGDLAVYFEIDSFLPIREEFEFLRKSSFKKLSTGEEGFRLKTIRLRGNISQGLALPIPKFSELKNTEEDEDVTEILKVQKYEPPVPAEISGDVHGIFPGFMPKTDEERIQNLWDEYSEIYKTVEFEESIKLDGTSMTVYFNTNFERKFGVCGRNYELKETEGNTLWKVARMYNLEEKMRNSGRNLALQGELIGESIQGNREKLKGQDFYVFRIYDIDNSRFLSSNEREEIVKEFGIKHVPILRRVKIFEEIKSLEDMLLHAEGESLNNDIREGLVYKSVDLVENRTISFKAISNKFLLKGGE